MGGSNAGGDLNDILEHFGVKGMKWGVRKSTATASGEGATKDERKLAKRQARWERRANAYMRDDHYLADLHVQQVAAPRLQRKLAAEGKYFFAGEGKKEYRDTMRQILVNEMNEQSRRRGPSPDGKLNINYKLDGTDIVASIDEIKHGLGDGEDVRFELVLEFDEEGKFVTSRIEGLVVSEDDDVEHSDAVEDFLEHFGVKGMKWGVRKAEQGPVAVEVGGPAGKKIKTRGGEGHGPSEDAVRTAKTKRVALKSTTDALSNKELQDLVNRMNLEQQYDRLRPKRPSEKVTKFLTDTLIGIGKDEASKYARGAANDLIKNAK